MKTTTEKTENIKSIFGDTALKSKEAIKEIVHLSSKFLHQAIESNKIFVDEIRKQYQTKGQNGSLYESMNKTFSKSVELSEEMIDTIIETYSKQVQQFIEYNTKLVDAIYESAGYKMDGQNVKLLQLIRDNFDATISSYTESMKTIVDSYNKHANLALNFNKKFGENINAQFQAFRDFQANSATYFNTWATEWWKQEGK